MRSASWTSLRVWTLRSSSSEWGTGICTARKGDEDGSGTDWQETGHDQIYTERGEARARDGHPGPVVHVVQRRPGHHGYAAVQLGFGARKAQRVSGAYRKHCLKAEKVVEVLASSA